MSHRTVLEEAVAQTLRRLRHGAISPEAVVARASKAAGRRTRIGRLALDAGMLTMREVFAIVEHQSFTGRPFGETAVALGLLDAAQVDCLLALQAVQCALTHDELLQDSFPLDDSEER